MLFSIKVCLMLPLKWKPNGKRWLQHACIQTHKSISYTFTLSINKGLRKSSQTLKVRILSLISFQHGSLWTWKMRYHFTNVRIPSTKSLQCTTEIILWSAIYWLISQGWGSWWRRHLFTSTQGICSRRWVSKWREEWPWSPLWLSLPRTTQLCTITDCKKATATALPLCPHSCVWLGSGLWSREKSTTASPRMP